MSKIHTDLKKIDPITVQVVLGSLENVAVEMGHKLARMSYSSIIRESEDFGCALVDVRGQQLCESSHSTPLQSGPIPGYIKGIREIMEDRNDTFNQGDVIMHNSPYHGASHGPDVGFCIPVFYKDELIGFSVTTAHHLDIGSSTPGSCGIVDAVDAYAEGLQFKAIKVYDQGVKNRYVWDILKDNIRAPKLVVGDMEAQIAAARIGAQRYIEIIEKYGLDTVQAASEELMNYSEKMMRDAIKKLPDGEYTAEGFLDGYLDSDDPAKKDLRINVTVKVDGSDLTVDLTGTSPQVTDKPINMPLLGTVDIAIYLTLRSILLDSTVYGNFPQNSGLIRPIKIVAPKGTLCNPIFPAPTIARFNSGNAVADTLMKALAQVVPHQVSAGVGNLQVVAFSGQSNENYWVYMDIMEGSYGGRYGKDGMDAVDTLYANTRNNPIEDIESHYPLRVNRYELRDNDSAPGKWRGGIGSIREVSFLADGSFSVEADGHKYAPWGFDDGQDGYVGSLSIRDNETNELVQLPSKLPNRHAQSGSTIQLVGPCGGGYGNPLEREPEKVLSDYLDGFITKEKALVEYGVTITDSEEIDYEKTNELRKV
ncbi:hydantoinase B/oxoprolinase family protein [Peribacillus frigoritolerans]|uniref:Putative D-/L-hydantoinase subunit B n=1 Tax=Pseudomonas sp. (strain NS671) TaxID=29441 RepID=HYUB_PSESN|nr:hydantoinase B/oxoprolinase family protein [Peribacillus frigoritolerans]Q01263.1 RecName: Full=Putative D-/L-hydantoinase subunit B; AltName: Full=Hydantoin utilization protein B [Pseudomonas sp. NS671]pir/C42594/ L-amino acid hydantoin hydrolase (ATP-hydrolyzing) (EC 3.5.2.-) hyuB [validated] - Pseudomonas sp. plasmid pHN671 [Pseudomonas sp.]AAA25846.1 DL-hydantoinase [Pseudomonas sp.]USK68212.1 hydantoinase B/oxoprolinase family protein [Peribacillus frigoritolerans]BAA01378.1 hydantoina